MRTTYLQLCYIRLRKSITDAKNYVQHKEVYKKDANNTNICILKKSRTWLMGLVMISVMLFHQIFHLPFLECFPFSFFHHYGHYGVDVFLFLSGFGIWFPLHNNKQGGVMSFYARRLWRIWPYCLVAGWIIFAITVAEQGEVHLVHCLLSLTGTALWYIRSILVSTCLRLCCTSGSSSWVLPGCFPCWQEFFC